MKPAIAASRTININATSKHTATLFFFHGSGSYGRDLESWMSSLISRKFNFPHVKIVYPTAPAQPYTPLDGMLSNVWFDRSSVSISAPEKKASLDSICSEVSDLIDNEVSNGIPINRIVLGGFSMGGALALHLAYRYKKSIAGCFAMSCFLNNNSLVYEALKNNGEQKTPPLLQFHGSADMLVPIKWAETTHDSLKNLGVKGEFIPLDRVDHEIVRAEIEPLREWILKVVPEEM